MLLSKLHVARTSPLVLTNSFNRYIQHKYTLQRVLTGYIKLFNLSWNHFYSRYSKICLMEAFRDCLPYKTCALRVVPGVTYLF